MAPGFNTRCNPQLLWAIIRAAKQLREISTGRIPQGQKVNLREDCLARSVATTETFWSSDLLLQTSSVTFCIQKFDNLDTGEEIQHESSE